MCQPALRSQSTATKTVVCVSRWLQGEAGLGEQCHQVELHVSDSGVMTSWRRELAMICVALGLMSPSHCMAPSPVGYVAFPEVPRSHTGHLLTCTWWVAAPPRDMSAALCLASCWSGHRRMSRCHCLALIPQTCCGAFQDQLLNVSSVQVLTLVLSSER